jgi:hypothetical protein
MYAEGQSQSSLATAQTQSPSLQKQLKQQKLILKHYFSPKKNTNNLF